MSVNQAVSALEGLEAKSGGSLDILQINTAKDLSIQAESEITVGGVVSGGQVSFESQGNTRVSTVDAGTDVLIDAKKSIQFNAITSGGNAVLNAEQVLEGVPAGSLLSVGENLLVSAARIVLDQVVVGGSATLTSAAEFSADTINAQNQLTLASLGDMSVNQAVSALEGLEATSSGSLSMQSASAFKELSLIAENDVNIESVEASLLTIESKSGNVTVGKATANNVRLAALKNVKADDLQIDESIDLEADDIVAEVTHTNNSAPLLMNVTGYNQSLASRVEVTTTTAKELSVNRYYVKRGDISTSAPRLSVADGWVTETSDFSTPQTTARVKNTDKTLDQVDVQIFADGDHFNLLIDDNKVTTDQYVVNFAPNYKVSNILGENVSLITQAEDVAAEVAAQIAAALRNAGISSGLVGQSFVSYFFDVPMVNGMDFSATASGPHHAHCAQHPDAVECNALKEEIFVEAR